MFLTQALTDQQKRGMVETTSLKEKKLFFWRMTKVVKNMEESNEDLVIFNKDEDIITIHLGKVLTEEQYKAVLNSVVDYMNQHWSHILGWQS